MGKMRKDADLSFRVDTKKPAGNHPGRFQSTIK